MNRVILIKDDEDPDLIERRRRLNLVQLPNGVRLKADEEVFAASYGRSASSAAGRCYTPSEQDVYCSISALGVVSRPTSEATSKLVEPLYVTRNTQTEDVLTIPVSPYI